MPKSRIALIERLDAIPKDVEDLLLRSNDDAVSPSALGTATPKSALTEHDRLLLKRQALTNRLKQSGLVPPLILSRAYIYERLGYDDLAAADAFVAYTLCESVRAEEWISDLEPVNVHGEPWHADGDSNENLAVLYCALVLICTALTRLGATEDAQERYKELLERRADLEQVGGSVEDLISAYKQCNEDSTYEEDMWLQSQIWTPSQSEEHKFGWSRREIYPWNNYESDRNSSTSLSEINSSVSKIAPDLKVKVTALPALDENGTQTDGIWHQLGLFAAKDLPPGSKILRERSVLTAIRPLDDALCDACGADLEPIPRESMRQCPGQDCDTTFCSEECAIVAHSQYHNPNFPLEESANGAPNGEEEGEEDEEETDPDYPPSHAPFCGNAALHEIGRLSTTTTPEFDLYFLLLTRTIQLSTTQSTHPLSLTTTKYLWGDFNAPPNATNPTSLSNYKRTLPWSLHHNLTLPLQYFETLMHSVPTMTPYSAAWLDNWDWWIQSTLYAKFRGVANAQQSTFDGRPEIAAVHPIWSLANHSCAPNVVWTPTGERVFTVREKGEIVGGGESEWMGIREGEEVWNHYTDVRLPVGERRERLMAVLGGVCRCARCIREAREG